MARPKTDDIFKFHDYGLFIPTRTIFVGSELGDVEGNESGTDSLMATRFIKNMQILESVSLDEITIILNNLGGDIYHGLAIYDSIRLSKARVVIKVFGAAMSMGSIILQAADDRLMAPNAVQMVHYGYRGVNEHAMTAERDAKENTRLNKLLESIYLERIKVKQPHYTLQRLQRMLDHDTYLTATQSIELGLADRILE